MPDFMISARTRLSTKGEKPYLYFRCDTADHAGDVAGLFDNICENGVKYQCMQITKKEAYPSLPGTVIDYTPWYLTFFDRDHPEQKLKVTVAFAVDALTAEQQLAFANAFILKHVQFQNSKERSDAIAAGTNPDDAPWYEANAYTLIGSRGKPRDVTRASLISVAQTPPIVTP